MRVFGHRGAAAVAPENTLASFAAAMAAGADGVETDVRRTADGALVLIHDDDVSRTTGGTGRVGEMTLAEVRNLDAADGRGGPEPVPTVQEVWEATGGRVIFEVKGTSFDPIDSRATAPILARFLRGRETAGAIVSSFDPAVLAVVRSEGPGIRTGLLGAAAFDAASVIEAAAAGSHEICFLADVVVTAAAIGSAHSSGLIVIPWTVNDPVRLRELAGWGADGVITDDPAAALDALR